MKRETHSLNRGKSSPSPLGCWALVVGCWKLPLLLSLATCHLPLATSHADTHYVDINAPSSAPPYTNWATAATLIQDAVDAAEAGDVVLVTNGVYESGAYPTPGYVSVNRVLVSNDITVRSVNGPDVTVIRGRGPLGTGAVRCVYITAGFLEGFTLTNGHTRTSGHASKDRSGGGGHADGGSLSNCVIVGSSASENGGGAYEGVLLDCVLSGNEALVDGGGGWFTTFVGCTLAGNRAGRHGGGAWAGELRGCTISRNSADANGGGIGGTATLNNCTVAVNVAASYGGGTYISTLNNCVLTGNSADAYAGAYRGTLRSCTISGNLSQGGYAGVYDATLYNCIIWDNRRTYDNMVLNWGSGTLNYCCTTPRPSGTDNITTDPMLLSGSHIHPDSPCVGAGRSSHLRGTDIDGEAWATPNPAIGCDQPVTPLLGELSVAIESPGTGMVAYIEQSLFARIQGRPASNRWDFGDGTLMSNAAAVVHTWDLPAEYTVTLTAWNDDNPGGVSATTLVSVLEGPGYYVNLTNATPQAPYTNWATAATSIQDAIDEAGKGAVVWVADGVYRYGALSRYGSNRVVIGKNITVRSVNGHKSAVIEGAGPLGPSAVRCVYMTDGRLQGFTLTNGFTRTTGQYSYDRSGGGAHAIGGTLLDCVITGCEADGVGGGVYRGTLDRCSVTGNTASSGGGTELCTMNDCMIVRNSAGSGGGVLDGTLDRCVIMENLARGTGGGAKAGGNFLRMNNCLIVGNSAAEGGGVRGGILANCTLTENSAYTGGGAFRSDMRNCIVYYNQAATSPDWHQGVLESCCTTPLPGGTGNMTNEPGIVSVGNPRLLPSSPCINAGSNAYIVGERDIDGEPRIFDGTVDIGCDEFLSTGLTGRIDVAVIADFTNLVAGVASGFEADISGEVLGYEWRWGDGATSADIFDVHHAYANTGTYDVVLVASNLNNVSSATTVVHVVSAYTNYVSPTGSSVSPFVTRETAATNIQDAIDAAPPGATVLVAPGEYSRGGRLRGGTTNRIVLDYPMTVRASDPDPARTIIRGSGPIGGDAVRCVYAGDDALLVGFTLTDGATQSTGSDGSRGGGAWCEEGSVLSNCVIVGNSAHEYGGGLCGGAAVDCVITANTVQVRGGGGAYRSTLRNCTIAGNSALSQWNGRGGGVYECQVDRCELAANTAVVEGGGAWGSDLQDCSVTGNSADSKGGGTYGGSASHCTFSWNSAGFGGGMYQTEAANCATMGNTAAYDGGGTAYARLRNCTVIGNSAKRRGGGVYGGSIRNSIVYYNSAPTDENGRGEMEYCCTSPKPESGINISSPPDVTAMDNPHLLPGSPCINMGHTPDTVGSFDIDGEQRVAGFAVDIGCDEYHAGGMTGTLSAVILAEYTNLVAGVPVPFAALVEGVASGTEWRWGDGTTDSNVPLVDHVFAAPGVYPVVFSVWNDDHGVAATTVVRVVGGSTNFVSLSGSNVWPYATWHTAATNVQSAIDAAIPGALVLVAEGTYDDGVTQGDLTPNRICVSKYITVAADNPDPRTTAIRGNPSSGNDGVRCAYLESGCTLVGFTLSDGRGGIGCAEGALVSNCVIVGNAVYRGITGGTIVDSTVASNTAGGAADCVLLR